MIATLAQIKSGVGLVAFLLAKIESWLPSVYQFSQPQTCHFLHQGCQSIHLPISLNASHLLVGNGVAEE